MSNDTITITLPDAVVFNYDNMNSSSGNSVLQDISVIDLSGTTTSYVASSDTITFSGTDDFYVSVTKSEHNELMDRVTKLEAVMAEEAELRSKHPALKTAYDEYRLLLVLAKQHTVDILTEE